MNIKTLIIALLFLPFLATSQNYEVGVLGGFSNYQGDLVEDVIELGETNLAWGLFFRYNINEKFSVRLNFNNGQISGKDANGDAEWRKERNYRFNSEISELSLIGEWNIFGKDSYTTAGKFDPHFTPYLVLGVGLVKFDVREEGEDLPENVDFPSVFLSVPVGGGLKYHFHERVTLGGELAFRPAFGDYLDGVSPKGNPDKDDWYLFGGVTISINFGGYY